MVLLSLPKKPRHRKLIRIAIPARNDLLPQLKPRHDKVERSEIEQLFHQELSGGIHRKGD